jgi:hypothetical protein
MTIQKKTPRRHGAKVALIEFLRPTSFWPYPYSIEMAFQTMRCLLVSGVGFKTRHPWHTTSVTSLLGGTSPDHSYVRPVRSLEDLRHRFQLALFANGSPELDAWREARGINAYAVLDLSFLHYKPMAAVTHLGFESEDSVRKTLVDMFEHSAGKTTAVSLNCIHHSARVLHGIDVQFRPEGFSFILRYGFLGPSKQEPDSEWDYRLAATEKDEPFLDTLARAVEAYRFVMDPANGHLTKALDGEFISKDVANERYAFCHATS